ncbi:hypothetical protein [Roseobacter sp. AzwK-3b]|uniref:hypothetical protein n=1 Tax=Roseobacter sp. AzwK-3b TaxID=351016 RepID=UPI0003098E2A|nr:hypothetical protein [Roseobacter sp. AzwK-3b]
MTTRIITKAQARDMAGQLKKLGALVEKSDAGIVATAPNGKEVFRAMHGTRGDMLARWPDGLFNEVQGG